MKVSKKVWTLLTITVLTTLLVTQMLNVNAAQENVKEKVLSALRNISGINVDKYTITITSYQSTPTPGFEADFKGEELIQITLDSKESNISVIAFYLNNQLRYMFTYIVGGSSSSVHYSNKLPDDRLLATREALSRLQTFTNNPDITDMQKIIAPAKTFTDLENKTVGNIKCKAYIDTNPLNPTELSLEVDFINAYLDAETPQSISVHFEADGFFKGFTDRWNLYTINNDELKITKDQAIKIAQEEAINAAGSASVEFHSNYPVRAELRMGTRGEGLELYPYWFVELPLVYSGDLSINAWQLSIWADTGTIISSHPTGGYGTILDNSNSNTPTTSSNINTPTPQSNKNLLLAIVTVAVIVVISLASIIAFKKR